MIYKDNELNYYDWENILDEEQIPKFLEEIRDKNILIWDFNENTKRLLQWLLNNNVYVTGFLLQDSNSRLNSIRYLNKPLLHINEIEKDETNYILLIMSEICDSRITEHKCISPRILPINEQSVILYGAGNGGKIAYEFLCQWGVKVSMFCDANKDLWGMNYNGVKIASPSEIKTASSGEPIVISMYRDDNSIKELACSLSIDYPERQIYLFRYPTFSHICCVHYLIRYVVKQNYQLYLYGKANEIASHSQRLALLDVKVTSGIAVDDVVGVENNIRFCDPYELLFLDDINYLVAILPSAEDKARQFIETSGIDGSRFIRYTDVSCVQWVTHLDPTLGYNINKSPNILYTSNSPKANNSKEWKIGILGGSTTDVSVHYEKSWPQQLVDILNLHNIRAKLYVGAVSGYGAAQELLRFIRDMSHLGLDILISYSGINDAVCSVGNRFISSYQKIIFEKMAGKRSICMGTGIEGASEHWLHQEHIMYAICREYGTHFYAVFQPWLFCKEHFNVADKEMIEHIPLQHYIIKPRLEIIPQMRKYIENQCLIYPWLYDLSHIFDDSRKEIYFDDSHLFSEGNYIVAQNIFSIISEHLGVNENENFRCVSTIS